LRIIWSNTKDEILDRWRDACEHESAQAERLAQMDEEVPANIRQGGLGIGLPVVKNLVELHGATIEAHSAGVGAGSEFIVRIPAPKPE